MSKKFKLFIFLLFVGLSLWVLFPTLQWYSLTSEAEKGIIKLSVSEIDTPEDELKRMRPELAGITNIKEKYMSLKKVKRGALKLGLDLQGGVRISVEVNRAELSNQLLEFFTNDDTAVNNNFEIKYKEAVTKAIDILRNRMDQFGVADPTIRATYSGQISIELPGVDSPQAIRDALSKVGKLTFQIVDEVSSRKLLAMGMKTVSNEGYFADKTVPEGFVMPEDSAFYPYYQNDEWSVPKLKGYYVIKKKVELEGDQLESASGDLDPNKNSFYVSFVLKPEGADIFAEVTRRLAPTNAADPKTRLAIILDDKVRSAPNIQGEIPGGRGQITGNFSDEEVNLLANVLNAGALPVKLDIVEERVIGASLGDDSIKSGALAFLIGAAAVILFMVIWYKGAGLISVVALTFNILFLIAMLAAQRATLTLAGIAGIALTVGIAVDANVIIYERIREELRRSRTFKHALENGYDHARSTIWDANITTIIAAIALYTFGSGTIKGFGITLTYGIVANVFAALVITRLLFDLFIDGFKLKKVSV